MMADFEALGLTISMDGVPLAWLLLGLITLQRLGELVYAQSNTRRLLGRGAIEHGRGHYPAMVAIHAAFLLSLWLSTSSTAPIIWPVAIVVLLAQCGRLWVLATLGPYWTTRIISSPDFPLVLRGPYRFVRHPNYWVVTIEIAAIPLMFGHALLAAVFTVLNAAILTVRIKAENVALGQRREHLDVHRSAG